MRERDRSPEAPRASEPVVDARVVFIASLAIGLGLAAGLVARAFSLLLDVATNLAFFGRLSTAHASPADNHLGALVVIVPVAGGLIVGLMARFGSPAIRGHGIPEAMERVLEHESRVPMRLAWLKPLSAAIAIGTGGPFGAEGPIIATGGAIGSIVGQLVRTTPAERKTLLAAGAAAGMAATFGSPVSAVLLAIELLLFELGPRSMLPVALAAATGAAVREAMGATGAVFPAPALASPGAAAIATYVVIGAIVGGAAVLVTNAVYAVERAFERLPIRWMWWPAIGAIAVGVVGFVEPRTLGVGYDNIQHAIAGEIATRAVLVLAALKLVSWLVALGSGTSGGTLAPLFTIGGGLGAALGAVAAVALPFAGVDPRLAAIVGMASMFSGASRALLASVVFAFETTRAPAALLPLLGGATAAHLVSCLAMRHSIMTRKIAERGVRVPTHYAADPLARVAAIDAAGGLVTLEAEEPIGNAIATLARAAIEAAPVVDARRALLGWTTRAALMEAEARGASSVADLTLEKVPTVSARDAAREALRHMMTANTQSVVLVDAEGRVAGVLTRSDLAAAHHAASDV